MPSGEGTNKPLRTIALFLSLGWPSNCEKFNYESSSHLIMVVVASFVHVRDNVPFDTRIKNNDSSTFL